MSRAVGHVSRAQRVELAAQHRHDLGAEDLDLLHDGLARQTGVVDEEQLALVVADVLAHRHVTVDDLLRGADSKRGLGGEVLHRRAVAVHRCIVEVRAELVDGILGVLPGEELSTQADNGLVGAAVAVVLVAAAVQLHHLLGVADGPEDVVVEEAVTVVGGLLGDLRRADRAVPHERCHTVERTRGRGELLQRGAELAFPVHDIVMPQLVQQIVVFDRQRQALADVLAEPRVHRAGVAAAHRQVDATVGQVLQHRVILGDLYRIVGGDQRGRGGQNNVVGLGRDVAKGRGGRGRNERRVVMLAEGEYVEANLVGQNCVIGNRLQALVLRGHFARDGVWGDVCNREDSELHCLGPSVVSMY